MVEDTLVLISGGLDSAVLLAHEAEHRFVHPVYVQVGLAWERAERRMLARLLDAAVFAGRTAPLATLTFDVTDVYPASHWAIRGTPPAYDTPDEDVYLTGRNLVLLTKAGVAAAVRNVPRIALGPLAGNPFPDATPAFFNAMARVLSIGLGRDVEVATPFDTLHKDAVIDRGAELGVPFELTLSCMNPVDVDWPLHCGLCSKCRERRDGFVAAGRVDPTTYASASPR